MRANASLSFLAYLMERFNILNFMLKLVKIKVERDLNQRDFWHHDKDKKVTILSSLDNIKTFYCDNK